MPTSTQIIGSFDSCQALTLHLTAVFFLILQLVQWPGATSDNRKLNSSSGQCPAARCPTHLVVPWFHQSMNQRCLGLCGATYRLAFSCDEHISARASGRFCSILEARKMLCLFSLHLLIHRWYSAQLVICQVFAFDPKWDCFATNLFESPSVQG